MTDRLSIQSPGEDRRDPRSHRRPVPPPPPQAENAPIWYLLLFALFFLVALLGTGPPRTHLVPDHLIGVWKTTAAGWEDRSLEFRVDQLIFGTGEGLDVNYVNVVAEEQEEWGSLFNIEYTTTDGAVYTLAFRYYPGRQSIRLKNRPKITWRKDGDET